MNRKIFVLDTSVLLYDKLSLTSFPGNDVVIPLIVLDELDRFKDKQGIVGENARAINRMLDTYREMGDLSAGIVLSDIDQTVRVEIHCPDKMPPGLDDRSDNKIIAIALQLKSENVDRTVIMVTKDINFRVKCDALGVKAEDYYKDNVSWDSLPGEIREINLSDHDVDALFRDRSLVLDEQLEFFPREPVIVKGTNPKKSALGIFSPNGTINLVPANPQMSDLVKVKPRNKEQTFALQMMLDPDITLVSMTGIAGSGKTFLSLMTGLSGIYDKTYKRIVITRPIQAVGKDLGFLPGDLDDKMSVWIQPIVDNFREGTNNDTFFEMMKEKGTIEIAPLPYIRGRTFNDSFIIIDEAQNASIHELKTVITRVGQGSKIVLLGDIGQVDTPYLDTFSNGLTIAIDRFKDQPMAAHISLPKSERSTLAGIASQIL